ncbi:hypothetical protein [Spirosoma sp.]|uniref:hypothetical protein n=1 Tax=Spirosoma sp. TaxID=1899569 RepID=UPI003B3A7667
MNRRTFIRNGTAAFGMLPTLQPLSFPWSEKNDSPDKPSWLLTLITLNDQQLSAINPGQIKNPAHPSYGGLKDADEIPNPQSTADFVRRGACAVSCRESQYYQSNELLQSMDVALRYLLKVQHADGTIDLPATNFHSTPDTGFIVKRLTSAYSLMDRAKIPAFDPVKTLLKSFLLRAGEALVVGGIHTPNHRWVVSAALAKLNGLWPDKRYVARVEQWLSEHIDIDHDGQYNERSTLIYSPLTNRLLITIARGLNKPYLLDYVRKNLMMTLYYVHPNGEIVSEASGRQDKALIGTAEGYYYPYRYMALLDKNGEMAALCRSIENTILPKVVYYLDYLLEDASLWNELPPSRPLPTNYVRSYPASGLIRIRRDGWDSTILSANPMWMTFHKGSAIIQGVRLASSFFGKGQFQTETIEQEGNSWILTQTLEGPYYQPYPSKEIPGDGDWEKMLRSKRKQSEIQQLRTKIVIKEIPGGVEAHIQMTGTEGVPVALELIFRPGGTLSGVTTHPSRPNAYLVSGSGSYTVQNDTITFGPGLVKHKNIQLRGALPATDAPSVYFTGFTPFEHTLTLS